MSGFGTAGPHREAETGKHEWRCGSGHDLALLDEIIDRLGVARDQVRAARLKPAVQRRSRLLDDGHLVAGRAGERGREFAHPRRRALVGQDDEFGRAGRSLRQRSENRQNARRSKFPVSSHELLPPFLAARIGRGRTLRRFAAADQSRVPQGMRGGDRRLASRRREIT